MLSFCCFSVLNQVSVLWTTPRLPLTLRGWLDVFAWTVPLNRFIMRFTYKRFLGSSSRRPFCWWRSSWVDLKLRLCVKIRHWHWQWDSEVHSVLVLELWCFLCEMLQMCRFFFYIFLLKKPWIISSDVLVSSRLQVLKAWRTLMSLWGLLLLTFLLQLQVDNRNVLCVLVIYVVLKRTAEQSS